MDEQIYEGTIHMEGYTHEGDISKPVPPAFIHPLFAKHVRHEPTPCFPKSPRASRVFRGEDNHYKKPVFVRVEQSNGEKQLLPAVWRGEQENTRRSTIRSSSSYLTAPFSNTMLARLYGKTAYKERFYISEEQKASLNRYPVVKPGTKSAWSSHNAATGDSPIVETDFDAF